MGDYGGGGSTGKIGDSGDYSLPRDHPIVHLSRSFDHPLGVKLLGPQSRAFAEHHAEAVITYQSRGGADETGDVTGRHEQAAFAIFDEFWQTTDRECNRRNA